MTKKYEGIEMEVITFDTEDILPLSGGDPNEGELD